MASQLSGGEQRRAIVARTLLRRPALLLADEPTSNLDGASEDEVFALLRELCDSAGTALLMVTHSQALAERGDRWLTLENGVLREPGGGPAPLPGGGTVASEAVANPARRRWLLGAGMAAPGLWGGTALVSREQRAERAARSRRNDQLPRLGAEGYRGTIAVENLDRLQSLYLLPLDVQAYVQRVSRWNPFPATWSDHSQSVTLLRNPGSLQFDLLDLPTSFTELVPGYRHVRIDVTYAIADRPDPDLGPVERRDSFFVYLLPAHPDPEKIARNSFPAEAPLFIPMPPH